MWFMPHRNTKYHLNSYSYYYKTTLGFLKKRSKVEFSHLFCEQCAQAACVWSQRRDGHSSECFLYCLNGYSWVFHPFQFCSTGWFAVLFLDLRPMWRGEWVSHGPSMEFRTGPGLTAYIPIHCFYIWIEQINPKPNLRCASCTVLLGAVAVSGA